MHQVSASIVAYRNDPDELTGAVRSFLSSPIDGICTVVDNSPSAELRERVLEAGARYIFTGENLGYGSGHNIALKENLATAEYQLVLNPDVAFEPEVLAALYQFMNSHPEVGLVMPKVLHPDGSEQRLCKRLPTPFDLIARRFLGVRSSRWLKDRLDGYELRQLDLSKTREVPCLSGCFMLMRSSVLEQSGPFDERYFMYMEDVDLCRRIGMVAKTVFYPHVDITHGYAKGSYKNYRELRHHVVSAVRYFSKWGWFFDRSARHLNMRLAVLAEDRNAAGGRRVHKNASAS